jgi:hypothetical protein
MALTNKQRAFVEHYLGDAQWNATEAASLAGYAHPQQQGSRLLSNVVVKQQIADRLCAMGAATEALMARWLMRIEADISPFVKDSGLSLQALKDAGLGHLIKGVRVTQHATNFELRDPDKAEELLARHLGMFPSKVEMQAGGEWTIKVIREKPRTDRSVADAASQAERGHGEQS